MATTAIPELVSVNPATLQPVGAVHRTDPADVPRLVAAARAAQEQWARLGAGGRSRVLGAGRECRACRTPTRSPTRSSPRPRSRAPRRSPTSSMPRSITPPGSRSMRRASWPTSASASRNCTCKTKKAWLVHEPLGVVAAITPWNIPFAIPFTQVATAVAAGNGVVLKPSELTPLTGDWVERVFDEAGVPAGLVQVAHGEGELGEAIVGDPGIAKVFFTGSVRGRPRRRGGRRCTRLCGGARARRQGSDGRLRRRRPRARGRRRALRIVPQRGPGLRERRAHLRRALVVRGLLAASHGARA